MVDTLSLDTTSKGPEKKPVVEWLNTVSYADDPDYIPSKFALEFLTFIKLITAEHPEENETPIIHLKMLDMIYGRKRETINLCFRGSAKTTLMAEMLFLFIAVYGKLEGFGDVIFALYVSDSIENGVKKMRLRLERRWQNSKFLQEYIPETKFTDVRWYFKNADGKELVICGYGAATGVRGPLSLKEFVYADQGPISIGDVALGDAVYTPKGTLANVIGISPLHHNRMFKLIFSDGRSVRVNETHLNVLYTKDWTGLKYAKKWGVTTLPLYDDIQRNTYKGKYGYRYYIKAPNPVEYSTKKFPITPYLLGIALGDGNITKGKGLYIGGLPEDITYYFSKIEHEYKCSLYTIKDKRPNHLTLLRITVHGVNALFDSLGLAGSLSHTKFIPAEYLTGSVIQRKQLLAGLLDTDGAVDKQTGSVSYTTVSQQLANGIQELGRSLGMSVNYSKQMRDQSRRPLYRICLVSDFNPFSLPSKARYWKKSIRWHKFIPLVRIEEIPSEPSKCILLDDPDHEFLTTGYIPTHNTLELGSRPRLAILDDLISDSDANSRAVISSVKNTVYRALEFALHPTYKIIWSGTPFNARDPLYRAVESGAWYVNVFPICEKFPCAKKDFRGAWEDRFSYDYVKRKYDKAMKLGELASFNQELMLRIMSEEERLIEDTDIVWFKRSKVLANKGNFNFYITTDFAVSEREKADFSTVFVWAYTSNGDWLLVDPTCKKMLMHDTMRILFEKAQTYHPLGVGIEVNGQQAGFISWIQEKMLDRNIFFSLVSSGNSKAPGIRRSKDKFSNFQMNAVPLFKQHKIWLPEDLHEIGHPALAEIMDELTLVTLDGFRSRHDDAGDNFSMLAEMKAWKPDTGDSQQAINKKGVREGVSVWENPTEDDESSSYFV